MKTMMAEGKIWPGINFALGAEASCFFSGGSPSHSGNKFNPSRDEDNKECIVPMLSVGDISVDTSARLHPVIRRWIQGRVPLMARQVFPNVRSFTSKPEKKRDPWK
jgi:hypothetical protein